LKYTYAYKTSDGTRHEASMDAESREAVFESLRAQGIRPIKVVAADGSKANGEREEGKGKREEGRGKWEEGREKVRWVVGLALLVTLVIPVLALVFFHGIPEKWSDLFSGIYWKNRGSQADEAPVASFLASQTRRYPIGDAAVIEKGILTGWSDMFAHEGERFLASFAIPGVKAGQRNTTLEELAEALGRHEDAVALDGIEARQIKAMVEGMKAEARAYVAAGGSLKEYGRRLTERQDAEIAVYERAKADFEAAKKTKSEDELVAYWESLNDRLRNLGVRPVSLED